MFSRNCPVCRTRMEEDMFSPLTLNITDLLAVPCLFMDQGCTIKLKKSEIVNHEKKECKYRKLPCQGCKVKFEAFTLPDHFLNCSKTDCEEDVKLVETNTYDYYLDTSIVSCKPAVLKLENSKNWFLLCADVLEDRLLFFIKHYSGEERKETFSYNLKIFNEGNTFSRSMSGVCTPIEMEIEDAMLEGFILDISVKVMEKMCFLPNLDKYYWYTELSLFKSYP